MIVYNNTIKTLKKEKNFIHLVLHAYKDYNSIYLLWKNRCFNHGILCDIYAMVLNADMDWTYVVEFVYEKKMEHYFYVMLSYTYALFCDEAVKIVLNKFVTDDGEKLLNNYGLNIQEQKQWRISLKERLYSEDLRKYMYKDLSKKDIEKNQINSRYLN